MLSGSVGRRSDSKGPWLRKVKAAKPDRLSVQRVDGLPNPNHEPLSKKKLNPA